MEDILSLLRYNKDLVPSLKIRNRVFNHYEINQILNNFTIFSNENVVVTRFFNKNICKNSVSEKYGIFEFSTFLMEVLPMLAPYYELETYDIHLENGIQEFSVKGKKLQIRKDFFRPVFTVFSSSNGNYPLIICTGLFRIICSNGLIVPFDNNQFNMKIKHFNNSVHSLIETVFNRLPFISKELDIQIQMIKRLQDQTISYKKLIQLFTSSNKLDTPSKILEENLIKLGKNLLNSKSDAINKFNYSYNQKLSLKEPLLLLQNKTDDLILNKYTIYNCYTELFNKRNTSIISLENERILEVLEYK